ncbi:hypothetical protein IEO21_07490 [Rhodonia placenta]|uniref:AB hydrolase-1 domain-containing protein n=1 Tax=Rhodonia placenta TaxID=104341 RepID=A0A8H7U0B2_9APHY|nr:hypothetical protein IEO21_07490 [Postia placenta]
MPVGPVDDKGTVLYFEDSGAPEGSLDYVTLVLVHGAMIHSAIFRKMIPYAAINNLRLVLLNKRDYPGSTFYSQEELEELESPDRVVQAAAIKARGFEFAAFMRWFIETESIPPLSEVPGTDGVRAGGIAILGWSAGNRQTVSLLAHAHELQDETKTLLNSYFRSFIVFDCAPTGLGFPPLPGLYSPLRDPKAANKNTTEFPISIATYFTQVVTRPDEDAESPGFVEMLHARKPIHEAEGTDPRFMPTTLRMTPEERAEVTDAEAVWRSQRLILHMDVSVFRENVLQAFFECHVDDGTGGEKLIWPQVKVHSVWCDMSPGDDVYGGNKLKQMVREYRGKGRGRSVEVHKLEQANHFVHWDEPERTTKFLATIMQIEHLYK